MSPESAPLARACIHHLFEHQAAAAPEAIALIAGANRLSYAELNDRANRLAHLLRSLGVASNQPVGSCVPRGLEMIVSLLAILKAGGAYLPLDPSDPRDRLRFMLRDAGAKLVLCDAELAAEFQSPGVCGLEPSASDLARSPSANPVGCQDPGTLAYLCYTSGSSGEPKAVQIPHRAVVRLVGVDSFADLSPPQTFLQHSAIAFDATTLEIWALRAGVAAGPVSRPHCHFIRIVPLHRRTSGVGALAHRLALQ